MTQEEYAAEIRKRVADLNDLVQAAAKEEVRVVYDVRDNGSRLMEQHPQQLLFVDIFSEL